MSRKILIHPELTIKFKADEISFKTMEFNPRCQLCKYETSIELGSFDFEKVGNEWHAKVDFSHECLLGES